LNQAATPTVSHEVQKPKKNWSLDDVPWDQFDAARVCPEILKVVKAAALVEYNAHDYGKYLSNVFHDDAEFLKEITQWVQEEVQHGEALGRWAEMADPTFNFQASFKNFVAGYKINTDVKESIRGSRSGELISRCIVETGTSSYYTALTDAVNEPVLKYICSAIAGDELRHYKLFYKNMKHYLEVEKLSPMERLKIGLSRIRESEDDELSFAYYSANFTSITKNMAANDNGGVVYNRKQFTEEYTVRAYTKYRAHHMDRVVSMVLKACGIGTQGVVAKAAAKLAWLSLATRIRKARKATRLAA
jgi:rubrerythrin